VKKDFHLEIKSKGGKCKGSSNEEKTQQPEIEGQIFGKADLKGRISVCMCEVWFPILLPYIYYVCCNLIICCCNLFPASIFYSVCCNLNYQQGKTQGSNLSRCWGY
jgi:hypothetical protein